MTYLGKGSRVVDAVEDMGIVHHHHHAKIHVLSYEIGHLNGLVN